MKNKFSKPTTQEIVQYLIDHKYYAELKALEFAERFWSYYESKGWVVGKSPMKDWKAAIRTWELNNKKYATHQQSTGTDYSRFGKSAGAIRAGHELAEELGIKL
jgi:hypothetical protein